jgi:hypothetical protein
MNIIGYNQTIKVLWELRRLINVGHRIIDGTFFMASSLSSRIKFVVAQIIFNIVYFKLIME